MTESLLPAELGRELLKRLADAGLVGGHLLCRVVIEADVHNAVRIIAYHYGDRRIGDTVVEVLADPALPPAPFGQEPIFNQGPAAP